MSELLADHFQWKHISTGDLLRREVTNSTEKGTKIKACWEAFKQVDDDIVIDLVKNEVELWEKKQFSWMVQGFPRTKVQALSLQKMAIIPDKFINLNVTKSVALGSLHKKIEAVDAQIFGDRKYAIANKMYEDQQMHMNAVTSTFNEFIF